jgi:GDP-L-fucose synthase
MNVLVLGQSGFVGSNIGEVLTENGIPFTSASRRNGLDLRDYHQAAALLEKIEPEIIINCAAHVGSLNYVSNTAADVITDNSRMILAMYNAMAQVCPNAVVINPIANCAYPSQMEIFREKDWWNGSPHPSILAYAATRRLMWAVSESFLLQHGVKTISLLVPSMYGPFDSTDPNKAHVLNALISKFVKARINNDAEVEVWGTGIAVVNGFSRKTSGG